MRMPSDVVEWSPGNPIDPRLPLYIPRDALMHWEEWTAWYPEIGNLIRGLPDPRWNLFSYNEDIEDSAVIYPLEVVDAATFEAIKSKSHHILPSRPTAIGDYMYTHYLTHNNVREAIVCCGAKAFASTHLRVYATS